MDVSDSELMARARTDARAFEAVFSRHYLPVLRYLRRRLGDDVGEELASETFARAFAHRDRYVPCGDSALPWLLGIATNLARGHHRSEARRLRAIAREGGSLVLAAEAPGDERVDAERGAAALLVALARLDRDQREVLLLSAWGELGYQEIAVALDIPVGTVRSRLSRARARLAGSAAESRAGAPLLAHPAVQG